MPLQRIYSLRHLVSCGVQPKTMISGLYMILPGVPTYNVKLLMAVISDDSSFASNIEERLGEATACPPEVPLGMPRPAVTLHF